MRHVRLAVVVDDARSRRRARRPASSRPRPSEFGIDPMASSAWRPGRRPPVVAADRDPVGVRRRCPRPGRPCSSRTPRSRKSSSSAAATSGSFCGSTCWRLTISVTCAAERREHVHELDAGDARADHDQVLGQLRRRVGVAGGEHPLAVDRRPVGDARPAAGATARSRRPRARADPSAVSTTTSCGPFSRAGAVQRCCTPWLSSRPTTECRSSLLDAVDPGRAARRSRARPDLGEAHALGLVDHATARRRWRSSPSTGCSPTGGRRRRRCRARPA